MRHVAKLSILFMFLPGICAAQKIAIKSNLLYWATTTPNISTDIAFNTKNSFVLTGGWNPFILSGKEENKKLKHWKLSAGWRHWIYEKYDGHFLGASTFGGQYNAGGINLPLGIWKEMKEHRYEGYMAGFGLDYGYQWVLGGSWNLEASFGFGWAYLNYEKYECARCGEFLSREQRHYFGPTNIGLSLVYIIKSRRY